MNVPALPRLEFFHRLSRREQVLVLLVAGTVFILANLLAVRTLANSFRELNAQRRSKSFDAETLRLYLREKPHWEERMTWLKQKQPLLVNRDVAGVQLEEQIKTLADQNKVILSNQQILPAPLGAAAPTLNYQNVTVQVDGKGDWRGLVGFLRAVQAPPNFVAFETASLRTDPADPKVMQGKFRIAKWYVPAAAR